MEKYTKNQILTLSPTELCGNGNGLAKTADGFVVFIRDGVPGDTVKAKLIKVTKSYGVALIEEFIEKSPLRCGGCPRFPACGGCAFQNISYETECRYKEKTINDDFERIGHLSLRLSGFIGAESTKGYRNKAVYPCSASTKEKGKILTGYYAQSSHRIIPHEECFIGRDFFPAVRDFTVSFFESNGLCAYDEETGSGLLKYVYIRSAHDGSFLLTLVLSGKSLGNNGLEERFCLELKEAFPDCVGIWINTNPKAGNAILGDLWRHLYGEKYLCDVLLGREFRIAPAAFWQVNRAQAEKLYTVASEFADVRPGETLLDLYCGTGSVGICAAKEGCRLYGVEISPEAVENAGYNAKRNGIEAEFVCLDAGEALNSERVRSLSPDVILLDPPRKGCGEEAAERIASLGASRLVYISCDPATLARDLAVFSRLGYAPVKAVGVDMFPRTGHVETVVCLCREKVDGYVDIKLDIPKAE